MSPQQFASDNNAGACPEVMQALITCNESGHAASYGEDEWTEKACNLIRETFEADCEIFFVLNGSAANALSVATMCRSYHGLICHEWAHIANTECGGPGFFSGGTSMLTAPGENGKLSPSAIEEIASAEPDFHVPKPAAISVTQTTEIGTVYSVAEIHEIGATARENGLFFHMDGARFANAIASLDAKPADITWRAGVDILSLGGSKNGLPIGEAIVIFNKALSHEFDYRTKQAGQIVSKMRFLAAPWIGMLENDAWLRHASHANAMTRRLAGHLERIPGIEIVFPPQANAIFAAIPPAVERQVKQMGWEFYTERRDSSRLMCAWDTQPETVDRFAEDLAQAFREAA